MKYRLTKQQIKILAQGKSLRMGRTTIMPTKDTIETMQLAVEKDAWEFFDFFVENGNIICLKKNGEEL